MKSMTLQVQHINSNASVVLSGTNRQPESTRVEHIVKHELSWHADEALNLKIFSLFVSEIAG